MVNYPQDMLFAGVHMPENEATIYEPYGLWIVAFVISERNGGRYF